MEKSAPLSAITARHASRREVMTRLANFRLRLQIGPRRDCTFAGRAVAARDPPLAPILKWRDETGAYQAGLRELAA